MTATMTETTTEYRLTPEQAEQFHRDGYLSPLTACSPDEMAKYREHIEKVLQTESRCTGGTNHKQHHNRHLDDRTVAEVATLPGILGPMQSMLGEDLQLWRTNFFVKMPGSKEIPWHQDRNYWPLEPEVVISAWIAIDESTIENSAVQVVPGTHRHVIPHLVAGTDMQFNEMADVSRVDLSRKADLELKPGQFILFNERTLHHSEPNRSTKRRMGMAIRVVIPQVRVLKYDSDEHGVIQVSGTDRMGFNRHTRLPTANRV